MARDFDSSAFRTRVAMVFEPIGQIGQQTCILDERYDFVHVILHDNNHKSCMFLHENENVPVNPCRPSFSETDEETR